MPHSLSQLNAMSQTEFTNTLGPVFEETPAIAARAWQQRPFESLEALHHCMVEIVQGMDTDQQLALIRVHPDLGSRAQMAQASVNEQAGAGLSQLTAAEYERFHQLNQTYRQKFEIPFILAVAGHTKASVLETFEARLKNSIDKERETALAEIFKIAAVRLHSWVSTDP
ncbi:OHCU decarboxylase [filamentous cyanobacterium CCP5]|nr:OHCU decarboxylase [filamentous cyanobacterium CCP5]